MALGLSVDLRERVVAAVDDGTRVIEAAKLFKVCDRVIYQWLKLRKKTNSLKPITNHHTGHRAKIKDWDTFNRSSARYAERSVPILTFKPPGLYCHLHV